MPLSRDKRTFAEAVEGGHAYRDLNPPYLTRVHGIVIPQAVVDGLAGMVRLDYQRANHLEVPYELTDAGRTGLGQLKEK